MNQNVPMDPGYPLGGDGQAPAKLKVYAPNGDTKELVGWLGVRTTRKYGPWDLELFLLYEDGSQQTVNKKVVVKNMETGLVCYNPRNPPYIIGGFQVVEPSIKRWLCKNPQWPAVLELDDNPVGENSDGINP